MNTKIISAILIFGLITVIPTVYGQLSIGPEAKQESIEVKMDLEGKIDVKHVVEASNIPSTLHLFQGEISNLVVTNEMNEEIESGIVQYHIDIDTYFTFIPNYLKETYV